MASFDLVINKENGSLDIQRFTELLEAKETLRTVMYIKCVGRRSVYDLCSVRIRWRIVCVRAMDHLDIYRSYDYVCLSLRLIL